MIELTISQNIWVDQIPIERKTKNPGLRLKFGHAHRRPETTLV